MTNEELSKLTPEQKRIRIAEICFPEYKDYPLECWWTQENDYDRDLVWKKPLDKNGYCIQAIRAPDYLNDLNAMHEAEKMVYTRDYADLYRVNLFHYATPETDPWRATATQRADAFLLTLG